MNGRSLVHYGIPRRSGRYKWGSGKNPFHHGQSGSFRNHKESKALSDEDKEKLIKYGTAKDALKVKDQLDNKEMQQIVNRLNLERQLSSFDEQSRYNGLKKVEHAVDVLDRATGTVEKSVKSYNRIARVNNTFNPNQMPYVNGQLIGTAAAKRDDKKRRKDTAKTIYMYNRGRR